MTEQHDHIPESADVRGSVATQIFVFLGGPLAWVAQLILSYFVIAVGCDLWPSLLVQVLLYLISAGALLIAAAAALLALRAARQSEGPLDKFMEGPEDRPGFASVIGVLTSLLFAVVILVSAVAVVLMSPCS